MLTRALATLLASCVLVAATDARADREKAAAAYKAATAALSRGSYGDAALLFETAYAEDPRGSNVYNAALAWQLAHDDARAADDFERAVSFPDLSKDLSDNAKGQLEKLAPSVAKLHVEGPPGASVTIEHQAPNGAHLDTRLAVASGRGNVPLDVYLQPGHYIVRATYSGGTTANYPVDSVAGSPLRLDVTPVHAVAPPPPPDQSEPTPATTRTSGLIGPATLPVGIGLLAAGVVAAGFSIGLGVATLDTVNQYNASNHLSPTLHDSAVAQQAWTNVTFVAALVLGAAGITALVTVHRVKIAASVGDRSLWLTARF